MKIFYQVSNSLRRGFTVVELLIVIVVVSILATITIIGYDNVQRQARDSQRVYDAKSIEKALETYRAENFSLPSHTTSSWETSSGQPAGQFLVELVSSDSINKVPVDPINSGNFYYRYYRYPAGYMGCDAARGHFVVFQILELESTGRPSPESPGFKCSGRDWSNEADYVFGYYQN